MSRQRLMVAALVLSMLTVVVFGGRIAAALEKALLALHGIH